MKIKDQSVCSHTFAPTQIHKIFLLKYCWIYVNTLVMYWFVMFILSTRRSTDWLAVGFVSKCAQVRTCLWVHHFSVNAAHSSHPQKQSTWVLWRQHVFGGVVLTVEWRIDACTRQKHLLRPLLLSFCKSFFFPCCFLTSPTPASLAFMVLAALLLLCQHERQQQWIPPVSSVDKTVCARRHGDASG